MEHTQFADLHMHSTASDGKLSPTELVDAAKKAGLSLIALTDHDNMKGIEEAAKRAAEIGIEFVPGIEISTWFPEKVKCHMLGYFPRGIRGDALTGLFESFEARRIERMKAIIALLNKAGLDVDFDTISKKAGGVLGRPHIARYMVEVGFCSSVNEAFDNWLVKGKPAYVSLDLISSLDAVDLIIKSGGVPVLAHPFQSFIRKSDLKNMFTQLKEHGLVGIEVFHTQHSPENTQMLQKMARKFGFKFSGGSDFHCFGPDHGGELGLTDRAPEYRMTRELAVELLRLK